MGGRRTMWNRLVRHLPIGVRSVKLPDSRSAKIRNQGVIVSQDKPALAKLCVAEFVGTYLLILLGCGAVHAAVLTGAQSGLWQVAIVWGIAIMLAIYTVGAISGAHINPAITLALAVWGGFSWRSVVPYVIAQVGGAFVAAATLFVLFNPYLK